MAEEKRSVENGQCAVYATPANEFSKKILYEKHSSYRVIPITMKNTQVLFFYKKYIFWMVVNVNHTHKEKTRHKFDSFSSAHTHTQKI